MTTIENWYHSLPPFTKYYFTASCVTVTIATLNLISPYSLILDYSSVFHKLQIWRLFTCFLYFGNWSLFTLISMVILVRFTRSCELLTQFLDDFASFIWAVVFLSGICLLAACFYPLGLLGDSLLFAFIYVWSKYDPEAVVKIYGFVFKAFQFPFIVLFFRLLIGGSIVDDLIGLVAGHLYYVLKETVPVQYGYDLLRTPNFMYRFMKRARGEERQAFQGRGYRVG